VTENSKKIVLMLKYRVKFSGPYTISRPEYFIQYTFDACCYHIKRKIVNSPDIREISEPGLHKVCNYPI